jgi:hypothetical protein
MKKSIKVIALIGLLFGLTEPTRAMAADKPTVVSFTMTPDTVDTVSSNAIVSFDLTVSNPTGIASTQTQLTLTDGANNNLMTTLVRTDSPVISSLSTVIFHGSLTIPATLPSGVYSASAKPVSSLNVDGSVGYPTDTLYATSTSKVVGAEDSLLVRTNGVLNYNYPTFVGPAFDKSVTHAFLNSKFITATDPIWKVGENVDLANYYEVQVPNISLKLTVTTPTVCVANGLVLQLSAIGACGFAVSTPKTADYQAQRSDQVISVTAARAKPTYTVGVIATQSSTNLPLLIPGPFIYGPLGLVLPTSATPAVCYVTGTSINVISGGTCTINYSSTATSSYLASDVFPLTFQITRTAQTVSFSVPASATLASKTLALIATSSIGAPVTFQSHSPTICSVTGSSLSLLTPGNCQVEAIQEGSATVSPASVTQSITVTGTLPTSKTSKAKTIVCVKSGKSKTFNGSKCPAGFKAKK